MPYNKHSIKISTNLVPNDLDPTNTKQKVKLVIEYQPVHPINANAPDNLGANIAAGAVAQQETAPLRFEVEIAAGKLPITLKQLLQDNLPNNQNQQLLQDNPANNQNEYLLQDNPNNNQNGQGLSLQHLQAAGITINAAIAEDASVILADVTKDLDLTIESPASIVTTQELAVNKLELHGATLPGSRICFAANVTSNTSTLSAQRGIENLAIFTSGQTVIDGNSCSFNNHGVFITSENTGLKSKIRVGAFLNKGILFLQDKFALQAKRIVNYKNGQLLFLADGQLLNNSKTGFIINYGKICCSGDGILLNSPNIIINKAGGTIFGKERIDATTGYLINHGHIHGAIVGLVNTNKGLINTSSGEITASAQVNVNAIGNLHNAGTITGQEKTGLQLTGELTNTGTALISGNNVDIAAIHKLVNEATIQADELVILAGDLANEQYGKILAHNANLHIFNELSNAGFITVEHLKLYGQNIVQSVSGVIEGHDLQIMAGSQLDNSGMINAQDDLRVKSRGGIINRAMGRLLANRFLVLDAREIANFGIIEANMALFCKAVIKFSNAPLARAWAQERLVLLSEGVDLAGDIASSDVFMRASLDFIMQPDCNITSQQNLELIAGNISIAGLIGANNALITAVDSITTLATAKVKASKLELNGLKLFNYGHIKGDILTLNIQATSNLATAILEAATRLELNGSMLENESVIQSFGQLQLRVSAILRNMAEGTITSLEDLLITAGAVLENAGKITSFSDACIQASNIFKQIGTVEADAKLTINALQFENFGRIFAHDKLTLNILGSLSNQAAASITTEATLDLIAKTLANHGSISTNANLVAQIDNTLHNYQAGRITANKAIELITANFVINAGTIYGQEQLNLEIKTLMENSGGLASEKLTVISELMIKNAGIIQAEKALLQAKQCLELAPTSIMQTKNTIVLDSATIVQQGALYTKELIVTANTFTNSGNISTNLLSITCQNAMQNLLAGTITTQAAAEIFCSQGFTNLGTLFAKASLNLIAQSVHNCPGANLGSEGNIYVEAVNLLLAGQLQAGANLLAMLDGEFFYETATLKANGELELRLKNGYCITTPINTPGALKIDIATSSGKLINLTEITTGKDFTITAPGCVFVNGAYGKQAKITSYGKFSADVAQVDNSNAITFAEQELKLKASQDVVNNKESVLASNADVTIIAGNKISQQGEVFAGQNLSMQAREVEQTGGASTTALGKAKIKAAKFKISIDHSRTQYGSYISTRANSSKPELIVGGDLELDTDTDMLAGVIHAGGVLKVRGSFVAKSFEEFDHWVQVIVHRSKRRFRAFGSRSESVQYVTHHNTRAIYDSIVSAGIQIDGTVNLDKRTANASRNATHNMVHFHNEGSIAAPQITIDFETMFNGNDINNAPKNKVELLTELDQFFKETALFQQNPEPNGQGPVFIPTVPLTFNLNLPPQVELNDNEQDLKLKEDVHAVQQFHDIIQARLVTRATNKDFRRSYLEADSEPAQLQQLRQHAYDFATLLPQNNPAKPRLTTAQAIQSRKRMLVYRQKALPYGRCWQPVLYTPANLAEEVARVGSHATATIATTAGGLTLRGKQLKQNGRFAVKGVLDAEVEQFTVRARTATCQVPVVANKRHGVVYVNVEREVAETGQIFADRIMIKAQTLQQLGGILHSGDGGTALEIQGEALLEALRTSYAVQGAISKKGRNYAIVPAFTPASLTSSGPLLISAGKVTACGIKVVVNSLAIQAEQAKLTPKIEHYQLPEYNNSRFLRRNESGGTSFAALSNEIVAQAGVVCSVAGDLHLANTHIASGSSTSLHAQNIIIQDATAHSSFYSRKSGFRGLSYSDTRQTTSSSHALASTLLVAGDVALTASQLIKLQGVKGAVSGSLEAAAPKVVLKSALEQQQQEIRSTSLGLSFFGSEALESLMHGEAGLALKQFVQEDPFVAAVSNLANAKTITSQIRGAVKTVLEGVRLAGLIKTAVSEPQDSLLGNMTDRWGLTEKQYNDKRECTGRRFNPTFRLGLTQFRQTTTTETVIPTNLTIGGDVIITGDEIRLLDGTSISAKNIKLLASQLLEIVAACDKETMQTRSSGTGIQFNRDEVLGVSHNQSHGNSQGLSYTAATLTAEQEIEFKTQDARIIGARLEASRISGQAARLTMITPQDSFNQSSHSAGVGISRNSLSLNAGSATASSAHSRAIATLKADTIELNVDALDLAAATIQAKDGFIRSRDNVQPVAFTYRDNFDHARSSSDSVGLTLGANTGVSLAMHETEQEGYTKATIEGLNLANLSNSRGLNTSIASRQHMGERSSSGFEIEVDKKLLHNIAEFAKPDGRKNLLEKAKQRIANLFAGPEQAKAPVKQNQAAVVAKGRSSKAKAVDPQAAVVAKGLSSKAKAVVTRDHALAGRKTSHAKTRVHANTVARQGQQPARHVIGLSATMPAPTKKTAGRNLTVAQKQEIRAHLRKAGLNISVQEFLRDPARYSKRSVVGKAPALARLPVSQAQIEQAANFSAGAGDTLSCGIGKIAREQLAKHTPMMQVDPNSNAYKAGVKTAVAAEIATGVTGIAKHAVVGSIRAVGGKLPQVWRYGKSLLASGKNMLSKAGQANKLATSTVSATTASSGLASIAKISGKATTGSLTATNAMGVAGAGAVALMASNAHMQSLNKVSSGTYAASGNNEPTPSNCVGHKDDLLRQPFIFVPAEQQPMVTVFPGEPPKLPELSPRLPEIERSAIFVNPVPTEKEKSLLDPNIIHVPEEIYKGFFALFRKNKDAAPRLHAPDKDKGYIQAPNLEDLIDYFDKIRDSSRNYDNRKSFKMAKGKILTWDSRHGELEVYNKTGKHIGVYNTKGEKIKPAVPGRRIKVK